MVSDNQIIYKIDVDTSDLIPELAKATKALEVAREKQQELSTTTVEGTKVSNKASEEYQRAAAETRRLADEARMLQRQVDANNKVLKANVTATQLQSNSVIENRKLLSALTANYNQLKVGVDLTQKEYDEFAAKIKEVSDRLKEQEGNVGNTSRNVGNYAEGILKAIPGLKGVTTGVQGFNTALKANPLGLVVTALTTIIPLLFGTQKNFDALNKVIAPAKAILEALVGVGQQLIEKVLNKLKAAFDNPQQAIKDLGNAIQENVINRFKAFGVIANAIINRDLKGLADGFIQFTSGIANGTDKLKTGFDAVKTSADAALKVGQQIADLDKQIALGKIAVAKAEGDLGLAVVANKSILQDSEKSQKERVKAGKEALAQLKLIEAEQQKLLNAEAERLKLNQGLNDTSDEQLLELAQKEKELKQRQRDIAQQSIEIRNTINSLETTARNEAIAATKARNAELARLEQERLKALEESLKQQAELILNNRNNEIELSKKLTDRFFKEEELKLKQNFTTQEQLQKDLLDLKVQRLQAELVQLEDYQADEFEIANKRIELDNLIADNQIANVNKVAAERQKATEQQQAIEEAAFAQQVAKSQEVADGISGIYDSLVSGQITSFEQLQKAILNLVLETIEKELLAQQAKIIAEQLAKGLASLNPAFIAKAIASTVAIRAAFSGARAAINSQKFAKGGILEGSSHAQGGIKLLDKGRIVGEVEGGEPILTKNITKNKTRMKFISQWNQEAGGAPLFEGGGILPSVTDGDNQTIVISVQEITRVQNRVKYLERSGRF